MDHVIAQTVARKTVEPGERRRITTSSVNADNQSGEAVSKTDAPGAIPRRDLQLGKLILYH